MSANQSLLFGAGGGFIRDPRQLPMAQLPQSNLYVKNGLGTNTNCSAANSSTFHTATALRGGQAPMVTANVFVTLATLSGRGRLYNVILPTNTGASYTPTAELIIDGVTYTITPSGVIAATNRFVIGTMSVGVPVINSASSPINTEVLSPNSGADYGFTSAMVGGLITPPAGGIVVPEVIEWYGMPFLQFEQSCTIKFKTDLLASSAGDKIGSATWRMLP